MNTMEIRSLVEELIPEPQQRHAYLTILLEIINYAHTMGAEKWCVSIRDNKVRFNIGNLLISSLEKNAIWLSLDKNGLESISTSLQERLNPGWDNGEWAEFRAILTKNYYYRDSSKELWEEIKDLQFAVIRNACEKYSQIRSASKKLFSPDFIFYLKDELKCDVPFPQYSSQVEKMTMKDALEIYKEYVKGDNNVKELYKWRCIKWYQEHFDINATEFSKMLKLAFKKKTEAGSGMLLNHFAEEKILNAAEQAPKEIKNMFQVLYDESKSLEDRISYFRTQAKSLAEIIVNPKTNQLSKDGQDYSAISFYLAMMYPNKYPLYRRVLYAYACELSNEAPLKNSTDKFYHYIEMMKKLSSVLADDQEAVELTNKNLTDDCYKGPMAALITQNVLWRTKPETEDNEEDTQEVATMEQAPSNKICENKNMIFYGPPGTGKTYQSRIYAAMICAGKEITDEAEGKKLFSEYLKQGVIVFVTFHQNYSYEDFITGLRPTEKNGQLIFEQKEGVFKKLCERAKKSPEQKFCIIIDEINRANISRVFGELITLLEEDKRLGASNEIITTLPTGEEFGIPGNVYIIGTMNTADKSIALIDIALRRRFVFQGFYPVYDKMLLSNDRIELLQEINTKLFDLKKSHDYLIGHAYFMSQASTETILTDKIIPLVLEYLSGNIERVETVFTETAWTVKFNKDTYSWDVSREE